MGQAHGLGWVALRYFNAAGAALDGSLGEDHRPETHLIPLVLQAALGVREEIAVFGTDYATPDGTCVRDYVHVVDLAKAHVLALRGLEAGLPSRSFSLGTGRGASVREILTTAGTLVGHELPVRYAERRAGDPPVLVADPSAAVRLLGWEPVCSDLEIILSTALRWHGAHPAGYRE